MAAGFSKCSNLFELEDWVPKQDDSDLCILSDDPDSSTCVNDDFNESHNTFKGLLKFDRAFVEGVSLSLPATVDTNGNNCHDVNSSSRNDYTTENIFINICPSGQIAETQLAIQECNSEIEKATFLVNLITPWTLGTEFVQKTKFTDGEFIIVIDVSVNDSIISDIKTQIGFNFFCKELIEYIKCDTLVLKSKQINYSLIFRMLSQKITVCEKNHSKNDIEYQCDSPKKNSKSRKAGKKSKRESIVSGKEKRSKFTSDHLLTSQFKVLGYMKYRASHLKTFITDIEITEDHTETIHGTNMTHETCVQIDLSGIGGKVPTDLKLDVIGKHSLLSWSTGIFDTYLIIQMPDIYKFPPKKDIPYFFNNNILSMNLKVECLEQCNIISKKLLQYSPSIDSGIGSDETFLDGLQFFYDMVELDNHDDKNSDSNTSNQKQYSNTEKLEESLILFNNSLLSMSADAGINNEIINSTSQSNQKSCCDISTCYNKFNCIGSLCPTYTVCQTILKIKLVINCGIGIQLETLEVVQPSPHLIHVGYSGTDTGSLPLKYCLHVASVDLSIIENNDDIVENIKIKVDQQYFKKEKNDKLLKNIHLSSGKLSLYFEKSSSNNWDMVWIGQNTNMVRIPLAESQSQGKHVSKDPEPLRITDTVRGHSGEGQDEGKEEGDDDDDDKEDRRLDKGVGDGEVKECVSSEKHKQVNPNKKKRFSDVLASKNDKDYLRTKNVIDNSTCSNNISGKKKNKAVKNAVSPIDNKENQDTANDEYDDDEVFKCSTATVGREPSTTPSAAKSDWPKHDGKRQRRSSENTDGRKTFKDRSSPPLSSSNRLRGIMKLRGRSLSESHMGSLEECLGEELMGKYGSVEQAVVGEYGCLEGLLEECGWDEGNEEASSASSKKSVRFSDVEKTHLFMSKASIVNQLANDDKKAMRIKMKDQKKKLKSEKRQAQKNGMSFSGSFNSSYKLSNGYNSYDEDATTEESDGAELGTSSSCETTDNTTTEDETDNSDKGGDKTDPSQALLDRNKKGYGKKKGRKNRQNKRVVLTNNMIFQLDMEA